MASSGSRALSFPLQIFPRALHWRATHLSGVDALEAGFTVRRASTLTVERRDTAARAEDLARAKAILTGGSNFC